MNVTPIKDTTESEKNVTLSTKKLVSKLEEIMESESENESKNDKKEAKSKLILSAKKETNLAKTPKAKGTKEPTNDVISSTSKVTKKKSVADGNLSTNNISSNENTAKKTKKKAIEVEDKTSEVEPVSELPDNNEKLTASVIKNKKASKKQPKEGSDIQNEKPLPTPIIEDKTNNKVDSPGLKSQDNKSINKKDESTAQITSGNKTQQKKSPALKLTESMNEDDNKKGNNSVNLSKVNSKTPSSKDNTPVNSFLKSLFDDSSSSSEDNEDSIVQPLKKVVTSVTKQNIPVANKVIFH